MIEFDFNKILFPGLQPLQWFQLQLVEDTNSNVHGKLPTKRQATGDYERDTNSRDEMKSQKEAPGAEG